MVQRTEISYCSKYFAQAEDSAQLSIKFNSNRIDGIIYSKGTNKVIWTGIMLEVQ